MGFFDSMGPPAAAASGAAVPISPPVGAGTPSTSFFAALGPAASSPTVASVRSVQGAPSSGMASLQVPQDFGDTLGQGIIHGLAASLHHGLRFAGDANRWSGLSAIEHALEPVSMQNAMGSAQQALTPNVGAYPTPGAGGKVGNVLGQMAPAIAGGEAIDALSDVPEGASLIEKLLGRSIPVNAMMGALTPHVAPATGAAIGAAAGPLVEGAFNLGARGLDFAAPYVQRAVQFLRTPTDADAASVAANYARSAVTPADVEAVRAAQEPVPGVVHPPAVSAHSDPMQAQLAALRSRTATDVNNPVDAQFGANLGAIHAHLGEHVPDLTASRPVGDSSADLVAHLQQAKSAAHDAAAADRAPLDAIKPHVHVSLDGMKKAYDDEVGAMGVHTHALLPDWLRQTFDRMEPGAKTSYTNAESLMARLKSEAAQAPADTTKNALLQRMRGRMQDALFNSTKFYDAAGVRLPAEYEGAVKDAQALANKSWRDYRGRFPSVGKLTPAQRFIADATRGKINPSEFANRVFSHPEFFNQWKNAISTAGDSAGDSASHELVNNASGESAASAEAVSRNATEQARGRYRYIINNDRSITPLSGVEAADTNAARGQVIVQRGIGAKPYTVMSHGGDIAPARAQQIVAEATDKLDALSAQGGMDDGEPRAQPKGTPKYDIRGARNAIAARSDALDAAREPDRGALNLARENYARRLHDATYDTRGRALEQTPLINGTKMRDFRGTKANALGWAEKHLFTPQEREAMDQAQEALIRNNQRYASIGKGQSPTEYLRQANKGAEVHPLVHVGAALSGHGIAPVAVSKGYELLSNRYANAMQPLVEAQLERLLTDPAAFLDAMGRDAARPKPTLLERLQANGGTRGAGHVAALLGARAGH